MGNPSTVSSRDKTVLPLTERWPELYLLLGAGIVKLGILLINGASFFPDSTKYILYADAILDSGRAFSQIAWGTEAIPPLIFRFPGYPLVIAGAKLVYPPDFAFVIVIFQCVLNGMATYLVFRVAERLLQSQGAALLVAVFYIFSESILWDNSILPDSIYGSLFNIVIFALVGHLIGCWRLTLGHSAALAALWGLSILTRDSGLYFTVLPIGLTIVIVLRSKAQFAFGIGNLIVFVLVTSGMIGAYVILNYYRTGEAFFSITGLENWLRPVFDMARYGYAHPFTGDDLVAQTVRETMGRFGFQEQLQFLKSLHSKCQCTPTEEESLVFAKYLWAIWHYPIAYLRVVLRNFSSLSSVIADPVWTFNLFFQLGTSVGRIIPGLTVKSVMMLAQDFSMTTLMLLLLVTISTTISTIAFWLFVFGIPVLVLREWRAGKAISDRLAGTTFLWLSFMTVALAFSMVHVEPRHLLPVLPAALVCVVYVVQWVSTSLPGPPKTETVPHTHNADLTRLPEALQENLYRARRWRRAFPTERPMSYSPTRGVVRDGAEVLAPETGSRSGWEPAALISV
jgi:hypothetical protein